jgi:hypothetical protein
VALAAGVAVTGLWSFQLLARSPDWNAWLRPLLLVVALGGAVALLVPTRRAAIAVASAGLVVVTGASTAYALNTAATAHTGSMASAGPAVASASRGGFGRGGFGGGTAPTGSAPSGSTSAMQGGGGTSANSALAALLKKATTRWAAATVGDQSAASLELASGKAVMAIGGWSGSDPAPTLAQFKAYVAAGDIAYYVSGGNGGVGGGSQGSNSEIATWVAAHYTATTVGNTTVYDLSSS